MTTPAVTITSGRSIAQAATMMLELSIDRLPVVDGDRLVGIVTRTDLVRAFTRGDNEIRREIGRGGIARRFWIDVEGIDVAVEQGNVVLRGHVESEELANSIVSFAERTPGVVSVESILTWPPSKKPRRAEHARV